MSLISGPIPNLVNGVSQQPYSLRLSSQAENQINAMSSVVEGLRKRPPTRHVKKIYTAPVGDAFSHTINRDSTERYEVVITNGDLKVFRMDGTPVTVNFPHGVSYLGAGSPSTTFKALTVADYTFILHRQWVVSNLGTTSPTRNPEALVWIRQGAYSNTYTIWVNGFAATYTTPDGSDASHGAQVRTDYIAAQLVGQLAAHFGGAGIGIAQRGSTIYMNFSGADFTVTATDSAGDTYVKVVKGKLQRFSDLPAKAWPGFEVEIVGDNTSGFQNYYLRYDEAGMADGAGIWRETLKQGEAISLNPASMPHVLVREANGTFTFRQQTWESRKVGDSTSDPFPSFNFRKIEDIFFHRNRLGFLSDENVVFSKAGEFFNFFRGTASEVLDSDPIDVAVSHTKVSILRHAVPFNEALLLFSDQTQFMVSASDILTPRTISINQTTEFEASLNARPIGLGKNVYFAVNRGKFSGIQEYYLDGETDTNDAVDVTAHVPRYIPGNLVKIAGSGTEDILVCLSADKRNELYVYKFYFNQSEKLQSAWSKWVFPAGTRILNVDFIESDLMLVIERDDGVFLEVCSVEPGRVDDGQNHTTMLDRRLTRGTVSDHVHYPGTKYPEGITHIRLPYKPSSWSNVQLITAPGQVGLYKVGEVVPWLLVSPTDTLIEVRGNLSDFYLGEKYEFRYRFSTFVIREEAVGGGQTAFGEGRLQLRRVTVQYDKTGYFRAEVTPYRRDKYTYVCSGRVVGAGENILGAVALDDGKFRFPVMAKNEEVIIDLVNDTALPCAFLSAEWEGFFIMRSRRV